METNRLRVLSVIMVFALVLSGYQTAASANTAVTEKTDPSSVVQATRAKADKELAKKNRRTQKNKHSARINKVKSKAEPKKQLDLSLPFRARTLDNAWLTEQKRKRNNDTANLFASDKSKKSRLVDLDGKMIMSQEQEADKRQSFEGAAIVINLKQ